MNAAASRAMIDVIRAVVEAVGACPNGCPAGTIYALLMAQGCTLAQYEELEALLIRVGAVTKRGHLLFSTVKA